MQFFRELGDGIGRALALRGRMDDFCSLAVDAFERRPPASHVTPDDVIQWVLTERNLVPQLNIRSEFGQPPVTVYSGDGFCIDVYFWLDATTTIHQHGFCGAFHVLRGGSVETDYAFEQNGRPCPEMMTGALQAGAVRRLRVGDTRPIRRGAATIHSLFHLDCPSVSVVARTSQPAQEVVQYNYCAPGIAFDPFFSPESLVRAQQCVALLGRTEHPNRAALLAKAVSAATPITAFTLLDAAVLSFTDEEEVSGAVDIISDQHSVLGPLLGDYVRQRRRQSFIISLRSRVKEHSHRLLLALLLTVPSRARVLELVGEIEGTDEPLETVLRWLTELTSASSTIGVPLDSAERDILRGVVLGLGDEEIIGSLANQYAESDVHSQMDDLRELLRGFRRWEVLQGLLP